MMTSLQKRCVDISYRKRLTHLSSVLQAVSPLEWVYQKRHRDDPVVLGNSHAALALWVVLEWYGLCDAEEMAERHGTHACRDMERGVWVSGGSLGQPETVAVGLALADPDRTVWLVTSDGACAEGSVFEAFRLAGRLCPNLRVAVVFNGFGAYGEVKLKDVKNVVRPLGRRASIVQVDRRDYPDWMWGTDAHYHTLTEAEWKELTQ